MTEGEDDPRYTRRKLLAFITAGSAVGLAGGTSNLELQPRPETPPADQNHTGAPPPDETDTDDECIEQYGGIEGDKSMRAAKRNIKAIHAASAAAADNTVHIPSGTWYIGDNERSRLIRAGVGKELGAAGIGFKGDGPTRSILKITPEMDFADADRFGGEMVRYLATVDHGDVRFDNLALDGNEGNVNHGEKSRQWGIHIQGRGNFIFNNVYILNHQGNMLRAAPRGGYSLDFNRCSFYNAGIGRMNQVGNAGHFLVCTIDDNNTLTVTNCQARLTSGAFIDLKTGTSGPVTVDNCYVTGASDALFKINDAGTVNISSVYFEGRIKDLAEALDDESEHGKWFIYRLDGDPTVTPTVSLNNIEAHNMPHSAFEVRSGYNLELIGGKEGPLSFQTVATKRAAAVRDNSDEDSRFTLDLGEISFRDVSGDVFNTPDSTGIIQRLKREEEDPLGDIGDIDIEVQELGAQPFQSNVPSRDDVGIVSFSGLAENRNKPVTQQ